MRSNTCILENYDSECMDLILLVSGTSLHTNNDLNNNNNNINNNYHKLCFSTPPPPPSSPLLSTLNYKKDNSFLDLSVILDKNLENHISNQDIINSDDDLITKNNNDINHGDNNNNSNNISHYQNHNHNHYHNHNNNIKKKINKKLIKKGGLNYFKRQSLKPFLNLNNIIVSNVSPFNQ